MVTLYRKAIAASLGSLAVWLATDTGDWRGLVGCAVTGALVWATPNEEAA